MRVRTVSFGVAVSTLAIAVLTAVPSPAQAATSGACQEYATVTAGVPDLFAGSAVSNPLALSLPLLGTPDLFTGPSCTMSLDGSQAIEAKLGVHSTAGLVSGQMTITTYSSAGFQQQTVTCGPASGSCEASRQLSGGGPTPYPVRVRCSVSGVVGAMTSVACRVRSLY